MDETERLPGVGVPATGLVALVTGANSGIGFHIARQLTAHGVTVWIGARDLARGRRAAEDLGPMARVVHLDVTQPSSIAAAVDEVGELDILVNNAGVNPGGEDITGTGSLTWSSSPNPQFDWERCQGSGLAYRSSKTAVNAVTLLTAQAVGERFKVNALAPGLRRTNLQPGMTVGDDPGEAAAGAVRLALLPDDGPTGALWSWDGTRVPW